jgi:hypothetical protein
MWHNQLRGSGYAELPASSDADRTLYEPELGLYGVFDGVGSTGAPAAELAVDYVRAHHEEIISVRGLVAVLEGANTAILESPEAYVNKERRSETTATVFRVIPTFLGAKTVWASVGDTRLHRVRRGNTVIEQISQDEGDEEVIFNGLGWAGCEIKQYGELSLGRGDGLIATSDGVNGDRGSDIMPASELLSYYRTRLDDAQAAAETIVHSARKYDDRTAIVVHI